ncbi:MAG TPA: L,D-transpeptidase [Plasticicumulans sp.]|nr:L,D-transpeptidase [Plasticicumulans sp.]
MNGLLAPVAHVPRVRVDLAGQRLWLLAADGRIEAGFAVSTAANGPGERMHSGCTPRGRHRIRAKIGAAAPVGTVFRGRRPTGETWSPAYAATQPARDWILSRILWLGGLEPGRNRYGDCDSQRRYIYIHGTPDTEPMGVPRSHGCIRMRNADVIELFDRVHAGDEVWIAE